MPLPTLPSKLGAILSADEIKAAPKATPPAQVITPQTTSPVEATPSAPAKPKAPLVAKTASTEPSSPPRATKNAKKTTKATQPAKNPTTAPEPRKLFVLDTNVLLHDSNCLFKFEEHDVFIPMMVLEELDHQKKGLS